MGQGYQNRDYEIIDYQLYNLHGFNHPFRGPSPAQLKKDEFFTCLGAAQTFGCFVEHPFPQLLAQKLNLQVLNAGVAGAGPLYYLQRRKYFEMANRSKFAIIQVMSGRSESNQFFNCQRGTGSLIRRSDGKELIAALAYDELLQSETQEVVVNTMKETRQRYVEHMIELLKLIEVPKILFWFSERSTNYEPGFENAYKLFGKFPQFVNQEMIDQLSPHADFFTKCISSVGLPQKLVSRFTGENCEIGINKQIGSWKRKFNTYYPSPEMHQFAFDALFPVCLRLTDSKSDNISQLKNVNKRILFTGGCARSGTSVLSIILGAHEKIVLGIERYNKLCHKKSYSLSKDHFKKKRFLDVKEGDTFYNDLFHFDFHFSIPEKWDNAEYIGIKYTQTEEIIERIKDSLGSYTFIYIYRDVFEVAESWNRRVIAKTNWPTDKNYSKAVIQWNKSLASIKEHIQNGEKIICLNYHDLMFTEKPIDPIFDLLGLEIDEKVRRQIEQSRLRAKTLKTKKGELSKSEYNYVKQHANLRLFNEFNENYNILS